MAITAQQERELLNALQDCLDTKRRANRFINAGDSRTKLMGQISIIISRKLGISITSAQCYIDARTGTFRDAGYMPYCTDPELKKLYAELEKVVTECNSFKWKTKAEAMQALASKQQKVLALADEIKKQPGGQAVIDRVKAQVK